MKKYFFATIFCILCIMQSNAQSNLRLFTGNQEMVIKAIDSALVIIRQEYILQSLSDTALRYGSEGKSFFGRSYTLGVIAENKLWCSNSIRTPWVEDSNFVKYRQSDSLIPVLSKQYIRYINQTNYIEFSNDSILIKNDSLSAQNSVTEFILKKSLPGLKVDSIISKEGWLVIAYSEKELTENDTCQIEWLVFKQKPDYQKNETTGKVKIPEIKGHIIGGTLIDTKFKIGAIDFYLVGILYKGLMNWSIASTISKRYSQPTSIVKDQGSITPIDSPQKKEDQSISKKQKKKTNK